MSYSELSTKTTSDLNSATDINQLQENMYFIPRQWITSKVYQPNATVVRGNTIYICAQTHTSGTFGTDWLTNSYWIASGNPPGSLMAWGKSTAPPGYLLCDGSSLDRTTYADLFSVLSTTFGALTTTHFSLPDTRGVYLKGAGTTDRTAGKDALGNFYSATIGTYSQDKVQDHGHLITMRVGDVVGGSQFPPGASGAVGMANYTGTVINLSANGSGTPRTGNTTEPQNLGIQYIIKY